ncbi:MAG: hypothetical protein CVU89_04170 [Firmicutes bacterium HGW-Firmicutes-14]|nr:MAG: hypothetical protein CVU89_04170 [Firmicutes bacterium HGW-Firmicutes-14]
MDSFNKVENELFITKVRWLTIIGAPALLWFHTHEVIPQLLYLSVLMAFYNGIIQFYMLRKTGIYRFNVALSIIDTAYLAYFYSLSLLKGAGLPQMYYFLILVMGIRYGMARYHWMVILSSILYVCSTAAVNRFTGVSPEPVNLLLQVMFYTAFGLMSAYIFKRNYQQQLEKEDLLTELQAAYQQLCAYNAQVEEMANTDPLTGLYNYRFFTERLDKEIDLFNRINKPLSLIILDIDHFKDFNDTYGHPAGDIALKEVSRIFKKNIRDKDVLCRYGGEEFLILLPTTGIEEAYRCAERIREAVQHYPIKVDYNQEPLKVTISGGVACFPLDASNGEQLLRIADEVLYSAKHKGRNKIHRRL